MKLDDITNYYCIFYKSTKQYAHSFFQKQKHSIAGYFQAISYEILQFACL